jgi:hypothetical protein
MNIDSVHNTLSDSRYPLRAISRGIISIQSIEKKHGTVCSLGSSRRYGALARATVGIMLM